MTAYRSFDRVDVEHRGVLVGDERDRVPTQDRARGRDAEHELARAAAGHLAHRAGLPEQHVPSRGRLGGRLRDRAPVAPEHQANAVVVELRDRTGRRVGARGVDGDELDRTPAHAAVGVHELDGEPHAVELVDAPRTLGARERVHRADPDRLGRGGRARDAREHRQRQQEPGAAPHRSTTRAFANAWVAAGTVHVPEAHRCHPKQQPGSHVDGQRGQPVRRHVHEPEQEGRAHDRHGRPEPFEPAVREAAEQRLLGHGRQHREREGGRAPRERDRRPRDARRRDDGPEPQQQRETRRHPGPVALQGDRERGQPDREVRGREQRGPRARGGVDERPQDEHRDADEDDDRRRPAARAVPSLGLSTRALTASPRTRRPRPRAGRTARDRSRRTRP